LLRRRGSRADGSVQLDIGLNPLLYDDAPLTSDAYTRWLHDSAVGYVALPDVELDDSSIAEAQLIRRGLPDLRPVWHDVHWTVFAVVDTTPLVTGPGTLEKIDADSFTIHVDRPGDVVARIRYSSHWDVEGPGCATATADGWTAIRFPSPGTWRVRQVVSRWIPFRSDRVDECPP